MSSSGELGQGPGDTPNQLRYPGLYSTMPPNPQTNPTMSSPMTWGNMTNLSSHSNLVMAPSEQSFQYGISYMQPRPAMPPHNRPTHAQPYPPATFNMQLDPVLWSGTQPSQATSFGTQPSQVTSIRTQPSQATSFGTLLSYAQTGSAAPLDLSAPSHLPSYQAMDFGAPTSEATQSANQQPANPSGPSTSTILKCPKCDATFSDKKAMKTHEDTVHICKEKKACEYPGCARKGKPFSYDASYRRHIESVHGVVIEVKQRKTTGGGSDDPMQNYLQGEGNRLRRGIRKRKREEPESEPETSETELHSNVSEKAIKEENERLRQQVRKMQEEMRLARAAFEAELQGVERRHRIELDEVLEAFDINNNDQAVRDQLKTLREKLQSRYENEIKILQNRHGKNERRLWNLLKG